MGVERTINVEALGNEQAIDEVMTLTNGGAHVVLEGAAPAPPAQLLLKIVRKRGRYGQIGHYGRLVSLDFDTICYKELVVTGTNASVLEAWSRALELLRLGQVKSDVMVSGIWPLQDWQDACAKVQGKGALKILMA